jgi:signal peptidase I
MAALDTLPVRAGSAELPGERKATRRSAAKEAAAGRSSLRWLTAVGRWSSVVLLTAAVLAAVVLIIFPRVTGSQSYSVLTNSMAPKYSPGTFLVVKPAAFDELKYGDVITFQLASGRLDVVSHRIVGFGATQAGARTLITKGDNNSISDPSPVQEVQVKGKLFYAVPFVGYIANALGNTDRNAWMSVGAAGLIGYGAFVIVRGIRTRHRAPKQAA